MQAEHGGNVPHSTHVEPKSPGRGRPVHPAHRLCEKLIEALAAIDCDYEALEHIARANVAIAKQAHVRAERLRNHIRPELQEAVTVSDRVALGMAVA